MHSFLKAVGFSKVTKREEMKEIILDVIKNYDEKNVVEDHPDGVFAQFSRFYGNDCGITVCGQYDDDNRFHVEYYYPFFRGTGITTQEQVTVERHADKDAFSAACDDLRIGITLIFYLQNAAEYMKESKKLLKLTVFDGERERTILSGIAKWYKPEDLAGKKVGIVANLAPRPMMGGKYVSEGMVMAADTADGGASVVFFPDDVPTGMRIH